MVGSEEEKNQSKCEKEMTTTHKIHINIKEKKKKNKQKRKKNKQKRGKKCGQVNTKKDCLSSEHKFDCKARATQVDLKEASS